MQKMALIGIIIVIIVVAAVAAVLLASKGSGSSTTPSPSGGSGQLSQGGTGTGMTYLAEATSQASVNGSQTLTVPVGNGYLVCAAASDSGGAGLGGGRINQGGGISNTCNSTAGGVAMAAAVYNYTNVTEYPSFTQQGSQGPNSTAYSYTVDSTHGIALTVAACTNGKCTLSLPPGCNIVQNATYGNSSTYAATCINQDTGTYNVGFNYNFTGLGLVNTYVFK